MTFYVMRYNLALVKAYVLDRWVFVLDCWVFVLDRWVFVSFHLLIVSLEEFQVNLTVQHNEFTLYRNFLVLRI